MDARAQELARKGVRMFKAAKERAERTRHWAQEESSKVLEKARAAEGPSKAARQISGAFAAATGGSSSSASAGSSMQSQAALAQEQHKIETLCSLGFSSLAARHALKRCRGNVEEAGLFLLDAKNSDELYAVEVQASEESPLKPGCLARIIGLRGMRELNGTIVTLRSYDDISQRWTVFMPDGAAKAIRAFNLDFVGDARTAQAAQDVVSRKEIVEGYTKEELQAKLAELAGENSAEMAEALHALSGEDLVEAWACCTSSISEPHKSVQSVLADLASAPREPKGVEEPSNPSGVVTSAATPAPAVALPAPDSEPAAADAPEADKSASAPEPSAPHGEEPDEEREQSRKEATQEEREWSRRMADLEVREAELLAGQARLQAEAEAKADRIRALEAQCTALQRAATERRSEEASASQITQASESENQAIQEERRELQRLKEKAEEAAKALQQQQEALEHAAQERELRLLEEESEQMRLTSALREESARLDQQRRHVMLLQQSLLKSTPVKPDSVRVEVQLDDTTCDAVHAADNGNPGLSHPPSDGEDEVWDLDWNALTKDEAGMKPEGYTQDANT